MNSIEGLSSIFQLFDSQHGYEQCRSQASGALDILRWNP
jgi:hypothetical protein